jgi:hypothetical protein
MALGVIACNAIRVMIAPLIGWAMAEKYLASYYYNFVYKAIGCKYMYN